MVDRVRDPPPGARPSTYRELLAMRVLSVDAYWQELRKPSRRAPREIPVPLWPGESLQQYEREFGRWLAARRLSLVAMREDPVTERNYRLQFAHTRVARTNARTRSCSRSRSRSPPRRQFGGAQQRTHPVPTEDRYSHERRPPDNGHPLVARMTEEQQRLNRSYSRERPQVGRVVTTESETRREYDNRQAQRGADARSHPYASRVPPPQSAQRQHVGDNERWNHSTSRSPQYYTNRTASPRNVSRSSSQGRRSASPHDQGRSNVDDLRTQLLARRVISVEAFRHELYKLRNGFMREDDLKRPNETMVRIPVILWPGETMAQYTLKFERWLASRDIPLVSLRDNPAKERSLWHSFAYTRAGTTELGEPIHPGAISRSPSRMSPNPHSRSRSRSRSSSRSIQRSSERGHPFMVAHHGENSPLINNADHPARRERSYSPEQRYRSTSPPSSIAPPENPRLFNDKTRRQLLERRILALEAFQKEVDLNHGGGAISVTEGNILPAIPVPLHPGESMGLYDHRFWTWLKDFNETKDSLRVNPAKERRFRMKFAYLRVNRPQSSTTAGTRASIEAQRAEIPRANVEAHNRIPLGVLKSARARLAMNAKRPTDDKHRQSAATSEEPSTKRARTEAEIGNQVRASSRSPANTEQKKTTTLSLASYHALSRSSLVPTKHASATRASALQTSTASSVLTTNAPSARSSTLPTTTASSVRTTIVPSASASTLLPTSKSSTPITIASSIRTVTYSPVGPTHRSASSEMSASTNIVRSGTTEQRKPRTILAKPAAPSKVEMTPSIPTPPQQSKTSPAPTSTPVIASTKSSTAISRDIASEIAGRNYVKLDSAVINKTKKPVEATRRLLDNSMKISTSTRKLLSSEASRPQIPWSRLAPASATSTSVPDPLAKPSTSLSSTSSAAPAALTASKAPTASSQSSSNINTSADVNSQATSASPSPTPLSRGVSATITTSTILIPSVNIVDNDSADTDGASSEPDTKSTVNEVSDAESNPVEDDEEHDGDVMNPDGCCCNKCMRSWAKTLTDRMDQLEQNVENLKREVTGIVVR